MPTRSPQDVPAGTIRTLGLPARAVTVLTRAGITSIEDLAVLSRRELAAIDGLGPGLLAAIRTVVPEPGQPPAERPTAERPTAERPAAGADVDPTEEESPAAPPIPSFESLRAPRRSSAVDLLVPGQPPAAPRPAVRPAGPRPPDYGDLLRLGVHLTRVLAAVPVRMVCWSVAAPVRGLRRLLAAGQGNGPQV